MSTETLNRNRTSRTTIVSAELPRELADLLREEARANDRSVSGQLRRLLRDRFEQSTEPPSAERGGR